MPHEIYYRGPYASYYMGTAHRTTGFASDFPYVRFSHRKLMCEGYLDSVSTLQTAAACSFFQYSTMSTCLEIFNLWRVENVLPSFKTALFGFGTCETCLRPRIMFI